MSIESGPVPLTQWEEKFIDRKIDQHLTTLKGIVNKEAIENKCIALDFDEKKLDEWVDSLT